MINALTKQKIKDLIKENLEGEVGVSLSAAKKEDVYKAVLLTVRHILEEKYDFFSYRAMRSNAKRINYLCMEFLIGPSLRNNLYNLDLEEDFRQAVGDLGFDLKEFYQAEDDPGLGNGGLGRLAACFMDSLATLDYAATGYSILYEYGIFRQKIVDGWQTEMPDDWRATGDAWLAPAREQTVEVHFDGDVDERLVDGRLVCEHKNYKTVLAVPYDMYISGKDSNGVTPLRLWKARAVQSFDMDSFMKGDYARAMEESSLAEVISKVLYPADNHPEGKSLRLRQQYFLVSASIQTIVKKHLSKFHTLESLPKYSAIHINDTHPALVIPELMRILLDDYGYEWEPAWDIVKNTVYYTNHTVMAEALEMWPEDIFMARLPRIYSIVCEINRRFCQSAYERTGGDLDGVSRMAVTAYEHIRMANLAVVGAKKVNGVSRLHSEIIKETIFRDFYRIYPDKFQNVTNGIAHRRWLCQANPGLSRLISQAIGEGFVKHPQELERLEAFEEDGGFLEEMARVKRENKVRLAELIRREGGIQVDPDSIFDIHIKRMHEYKRQHLNALRILSLYIRMKEDRSFRDSARPRTFVFGAKAAPGYDMAKQIIRFIWNLSQVINSDRQIDGKLKVYFVEDYKVSLAEVIIPAAEISQQISLAGKEASGTGNMKLMINGALTLGTYDGANVEIHEAVGEDHIFIFGLRDYQIREMEQTGYRPMDYVEKDPVLARSVSAMKEGFEGIRFEAFADQLYAGCDPYMVAADFTSYCQASQKAEQAYGDLRHWNRMSLHNISRAGRFAADRSIRDYAETIWNAEPVKKW